MQSAATQSRLYSPQQSLDVSQGRPDSSLQSVVLSQLSAPKSHPIQVTGEDVEHMLSTLELAQAPLEQPWDQHAAQRNQSQSMPKHKQHMSKPSRSHSRNSSFGSAAADALQPSKPKSHRRSSSGEQPATSLFVLPGKRPQGRAVMQEPPLSTRSSYRMDAPWENVAQGSAQSFGPGSAGIALAPVP